MAEVIRAPMYGHDGAVIGILGVARDLSERRQHEKFTEFQARRAEALLQLPVAAESMDEEPVAEEAVEEDAAFDDLEDLF